MAGPLEGIKIADLTAYISGAYATVLLADLGAEVVKVESFDGDGFRTYAAPFLAWNRGKRAIILNLQEKDGKEAFYRMVRKSDVVIENSRPGLTKRLGTDYETIRKIKEDIVYVSLTGWGTSGPHGKAPAWDPLVQGYSGEMKTMGGYDQPPLFHKVCINDYQCAMCGTMAVVFGIYHKLHTGKGQMLSSSLVNAAAYHMAGFFADYHKRPLADVGGDRIKGVNPAQRIYETKDGYILVDCHYAQQWTALCSLVGRPDLAQRFTFSEVTARSAYDYEIVSAIQGVFKRKTSAEWFPLLSKAGVPTAPDREIMDLLEDPHIEANNWVRTWEQKRRGETKQLVSVLNYSDTPTVAQGPAPIHGEHTVEVMKELGYTQEQINDMLARKVIGQQGLNIVNEL